MIVIHSIKQKIFTHATQTLGFDDCRFTDPFLQDHLEESKKWLAQNFHGDMKYLEDHLKFKENPDLLLAGVQSAIVLIKNYKNTSVRRLEGEFKIARYAAGKDYHLVMKERLEKLIGFLKKENPGMECYAGVDSRPLAERSLALKAGIGFRGKNTMVIKPGLGSYFFIGVILTNYSFENDSALNWNCGNCRLCLDACPTQALSEPYSLNATKCISYKTIEQKDPLRQEELKKTEGWIFGCDICQEVCPYNHGRTPLSDWKEFQPNAGVGFDFFRNLSFLNASIGNPDKINGSPTKNLPAGRQAFGGESIPKDTPLYRSRKRVVPNFKLARQTN